MAFEYQHHIWRSRSATNVRFDPRLQTKETAHQESRAHAVTRCFVALYTRRHFARGSFPETNGSVVACGNHNAPIRRHGHGHHSAPVACKHLHALSGGRIPQPDSAHLYFLKE